MSSNEKVSNILGDRKEAVVTTTLSEKKSLTKDVEKGIEEFSDTLFYEKKSSTKDVDKGTDELSDKILYEKKSWTKNFEKGTDEFSDKLFFEKKPSTKNVEKGTDEFSDTLFSEKKSSTIDVDIGTDNLVFMKQKVNTICSKGLNYFEGQYNGSKLWFKLYIDFSKQLFLKVIKNSKNYC